LLCFLFGDLFEIQPLGLACEHTVMLASDNEHVARLNKPLNTTEMKEVALSTEMRDVPVERRVYGIGLESHSFLQSTKPLSQGPIGTLAVELFRH
jgi:hypothetical protein